MVRERLVPALRIVPAFELVGLVDVGVDGHGSGAQEGQAAAAEVGDFDAFEGDDGFRRDVEGRGAVAPYGEAAFVLGVVNEG